jgi:fused signal recognition particle receptor
MISQIDIDLLIERLQDVHSTEFMIAAAVAAGILVILLAVILLLRRKKIKKAALSASATVGAEKTLTAGLERTRQGLLSRLGSLLAVGKKISTDIYEELEEVLVAADIGAGTTIKILDAVREKASRSNLSEAAALKNLVKEEIAAILDHGQQDFEYGISDGTYAIMVVGVNGAGKTTTIGKIAAKLSEKGHSVVLGAGDTFRAAAIDQLNVWAERAEVRIVKTAEGADPSGVVFDAVKSAAARGDSHVVCDTAGRLHTQTNLMEELKKIKRVMGKALEGAPHEVLLVLDATTGQNAISQTELFNKALGVTGIVITKLDGTAKGGVIVPIVDRFNIPVRYIGIGEQVGDLRRFEAGPFTDALFGE